MSYLHMTQNQLAAYLPIAMKADVVPFIIGEPGMGKSAIVKEIAEKENLELIDLRLSQLMVYDLAGLISPDEHRTKAKYLPVDIFPLEGDDLPKGKSGYCLFLDEFNSADRTTLAGAYKLILDRKIGDHNLHPNTRIICAGNRIKDNAITNRIGTAMQSRLVHIEMENSIKEFREYAEESNWDPIILSYFHFQPAMINTYKPEDAENVTTFATSRTWEFLNKQLSLLLKQNDQDMIDTVICGTIGEQAGTDFASYLRIFKDLPSLNDILTNPSTCKIPQDDNIGGKWAVSAFLADKFNQQTEKALVEYITRLNEPDLVVLAFRMAIKRYPLLARNAEVMQFVRGTNQLINQTTFNP